MQQRLSISLITLFEVVYIAPLKALVKERMEDWKIKIGQALNKTMVELTGDVAPDQKEKFHYLY